MTQETALGAALKAAVQTMSKKKQTDLIADYIYKKYDVFNRFKPLAIGIDKDLIQALTQYDGTLVSRVLANHCRRPRYIKALARGGKRFNLEGRFKGEVTAEEQAVAQAHPCMQTQQTKETALDTKEATLDIDVVSDVVEMPQNVIETPENTITTPEPEKNETQTDLEKSE